MPRNLFQRMIFALLTVIVTVHSYVFYSLYVVNGLNIAAINEMGGVPAYGTFLPIWAIILIEFAFAFTLECVMGSPCSFRLAKKVFDPRNMNPVLFETAIICTTVALMCPAMSLIAACLYYPYQFAKFNFITLLANWLKLVCYNFPFAYLSQLFFIQPLIRTLFKLIFRKDLKKRALAVAVETQGVSDNPQIAPTSESSENS